MNTYCLRSDKLLNASPTVGAVLDVAQARGANRHRLLRGTGIFEEDISGDYRISPNQLLVLLSNAQSQCRSRDTAFQIGKSLATSHLNDTMDALGTCYSLADVIRLCATKRWVFSPFISFNRFSSKDDVIFVIEDAIGCGKLWPFVIELYASLWVALCKHWCGQRQPFHFDFPSTRPRQIQEYEEHLGYRLAFDTPLLSVRIKRDVLSAALPNRDPTSRQALLAQLNYHVEDPRSLLDYVRAVVRSSPAISLEDMAAKSGVSAASLKRRLKEHNSSFRALVDETRREYAIYLLAVQKLNNEKSALSMAFTDLTNFRRAVKRWTGQTPSELRRA